MILRNTKRFKFLLNHRNTKIEKKINKNTKTFSKNIFLSFNRKNIYKNKHLYNFVSLGIFHTSEMNKNVTVKCGVEKKFAVR